MNINETLIQALAPLGCPVVPDVYEGPEKTYIVFVYDAAFELYGNNTPQAIRYEIQLHLNFPVGVNPFELIQRIIDLMLENGFTVSRVENASDLNGQYYMFECEAVGGLSYGEI